MTPDELKAALLGSWVSIAPEIRPSKNPDGTLRPFFLRRHFVYQPDDRFDLTVTNYADAYGAVTLAKIEIGGHMAWRGEHAVAPGAQKVDFVADEAYAVTPVAPLFAGILNQVASTGYAQWKVGEAQSIFEKSFPPFGLVEGQYFKEYDLVHIAGGMLFWGARHFDGRGFDTEENRPTNLRIPLVRAA